MIKAVIFDLDDTLTPEFEFVQSGFHAVSKALATTSKISGNEIYSNLISAFENSPKNVFNRVCESLGIDLSKDDINELVELYRNHTPQISFYEDVIPILVELRSKGIKLSIITDGFKLSQRNKLKALGAEKYADQIIVTDELGKDYWKPSPKSFELIKQLLDIEYNEMMYVGDNPKKDFYIQKLHPVHTCRIIRNGVYEKTDYYMNIQEEFKINNLTELTKLIDMIR